MPVAAVAPKVTAVVPVKFVPLIVTLVPPVAGPEVGEMLVTVGAATYVNWSAALVALVPPGVVILTSTVPVPAGAVAVICVALTTVMPVAAVAPKVTAVVPVKFVPLIVTLVPPVAGPEVGEMLVTVGAATYVNWSAALVALVPPGVVILTSTVPVPAGAVAVICVALTTVMPVAAVAPKVTAVVPVKFVPLMVTLVPPVAGPEVGEILVTVGAATYVNWSAALVALVPPGVVILTSTVPVPAGAVAVICVALTTVMPVAAVAPKVTAVVPVKFVPLMVTLVPPVAGPEVGEILVTVGAATYVNWSAALVALVPPGVVILTSTVPVPAGAVAVICVALTTVKPVAAVAPKVTAVAPTRFAPLMVTLMPPAAGPDVGEILLTVGAATYVNWSAALVALVPPPVVTLTSTVPEPAGAVAVICVALLKVKLLAAVPPKVTAVTPAKFVPVMVTLVPPVAGPDVGEMLLTVGAARYVNWSAEPVALVPPPVVTLTSTVPVPAGAVAVICVALLKVKLLAAVPPKVTAVTPAKFVPLMVTLVPPAAGPEVGEILPTVGVAR